MSGLGLLQLLKNRNSTVTVITITGRLMAGITKIDAFVQSSPHPAWLATNRGECHDPDRIFDAFMTTKEKSMGIGLAVSRSIVEAHGGRLWAENMKTGGATFNVALPFTHTSRITPQTQERA
jgi:phosphoglycerate-specific signal transduction histidine kinase